MYQVDFNHPVHVYFIGIGGISMSGLAEILLSEGFRVSGSDWNCSPLTKRLEEQGALIHYGRPQKAENIEADVDLVVYTAAVHEDNPELMETRRRGLPSLTRAQLLGQMMKNYKLPIAVSGTHGKTTTTSMIAEILLSAKTDPTISVGGVLKDIGGNIRVGGSELFLTEACEYTNSFLSFFPKIGIILNIEEDHLDFFKDLADIRSSFRRFAELIPEDGLLIINGSIPALSEITDGLSCRVVTFGNSPEDDCYFTDAAHDEEAHASFTFHCGEKQLPVRLSVPGVHNILNATAALALADHLGLDMKQAAESLHDFHGTDRRFEYKGTVGGVTIIDDYAHHPTEIEATLKAAADYPHKTLWCVFQPHTYTRTKAFFHEFAKALSLADRVILADIYAARETDTLGISSALLCQEIKKLGTDCHYFPSFDEIEKFILENCTPGDLLITMGAGNVVNIGEDLLGQ
ncbi:MAG TPA: UDP-N-acetylmuramate--L-alanine ligase [Candidatus Eisenbergiella merdipullorum]|uniref:UDP-N-acetylmuramate--L-alanine ligase n=1 Tax=Candidatus Eisenbergiella merdipullorum TaxID=2838553 RepID=A0A9D2I641_9FIRM|nr:UDP-N-acetylmuramate--L-alanine ligase [Candidatus Eisenbergiella merdipullorum]